MSVRWNGRLRDGTSIIIGPGPVKFSEDPVSHARLWDATSNKSFVRDRSSLGRTLCLICASKMVQVPNHWSVRDPPKILLTENESSESSLITAVLNHGIYSDTSGSTIFRFLELVVGIWKHFLSLVNDTNRCREGGKRCKHKLTLAILSWIHQVNQTYRKTSNISRTLVGNEIVDNVDVVGASPVGAAPTTSSFST